MTPGVGACRCGGGGLWQVLAYEAGVFSKDTFLNLAVSTMMSIVCCCVVSRDCHVVAAVPALPSNGGWQPLKEE